MIRAPVVPRAPRAAMPRRIVDADRDRAAGSELTVDVSPVEPMPPLHFDGRVHRAPHLVPGRDAVACEATARAQTKLEVECTPPRTVLDYRLKTVTDAEGQARFVAAMENLRVRLPGVLARLEQASSVSAAGVGLTIDAKDAVKGGIQVAAKAVAKGDLRTVFGLTCAAREVDQVADTIKDSNDRLAKSVRDCTAVRAALGAP